MSLATTYYHAVKGDLFKTISDVAETLGTPTYVVGGFVRDYILGRGTPTDVDVVCVGSGIEFAKALSKRLKGKPKVNIFKSFGTAMVCYDGLQIEFVGARKESYQRDSRKPVVEEGSLRDDQRRRDFTVNALAISLNKDDFGTLTDPFDGITDLEKGILQTPCDPHITYSDDPLRMLRAIRFATQLDFKITPNSFQAIWDNRQRMEIVSKERIVEELHKILKTPCPSKGFLLLNKAGLLDGILPEICALQGVDRIKGQGHKDNFFHTLQVVDNICLTSDNLWLRWAALLHDIGKAPTKRFDNTLGWTFHGHEFVGSKMVYKLFKRLKMPLNDHMKFVQKMVLLSSRPIAIAEDNATDSAVRRLIFDAGNHVEELMLLCEADITTKNKIKRDKYRNNFRMVREKIILVEERDHIRNFQPPISGEDIMRTFGIEPSREIGVIKDAIKEAVLEGDIPNEYTAARDFMLEKGIEIGLKVVSDET